MNSVSSHKSSRRCIHILATHYGDYNLDYERFFYENRAILEECGIAYPWLNSIDGEVFWQMDLYNIFLQIRNNDKNILYSLSRILDHQQHLLLVAPMGLLKNVEILIRLLREGQLFPEWFQAETYCVWLACNRAKEMEGVYRYNLPFRKAEELYKSCIANREYWFEILAATLQCADVGKCRILQDDSEAHIPIKEILEPLALPLPLERCKPLRDKQAESREVAYITKQWQSLFPYDHDAFANLVRDEVSQDEQTFLDPSWLEDIHNAFSPAMEKLALEHGGALAFNSWPLSRQWKPFTAPKVEHSRTLTEKLLKTLSPEMRSLSLRVLAKGWDTSWIGSDAEAYIHCLSERLGVPPSPEPTVSVLTLTRNHERFIAECIENVLAQQTDFPVEHIIVDDCSTDRTRKIITDYARKYSSISPVLLQGAATPGRNVLALFQKCRSKYVALCDGDDYFTDPLKLQKQVNFLENHSECSLCFHPVDVIYEDGSPSRVYPPDDMLPNGVRRFYTIKDLLFANLMQTSSVLYRWRFRDGLPDWFDPSLVPSDWYWHFLHAEMGFLGYMCDHMSVYRRHTSSLYASADGNHVNHRAVFGLEELRMYSVCNEHFHGRYYKDFYRFASGIFADFLQLYIASDDDSLLQQACSLYPSFARDFLAQIDFHKASPRQEH